MAINISYGPIGMPIIAAYGAGMNKARRRQEQAGQQMLMQQQHNEFAYGQQQRALMHEEDMMRQRGQLQVGLAQNRFAGQQALFDERQLFRKQDENARAIAAGRNPPWPELEGQGGIGGGMFKPKFDAETERVYREVLSPC